MCKALKIDSRTSSNNLAQYETNHIATKTLLLGNQIVVPFNVRFITWNIPHYRESPVIFLDPCLNQEDAEIWAAIRNLTYKYAA